jgi:regulator of sirC expression with transglutaminase-like and TPR domain
MIRKEFQSQLIEMLSRDEGSIELDRMALLIAAEEYPQLEIEKYLSVLDSFARRARELDDRDGGPLERIRQLSAMLFKDLGFHGNVKNYYDARNSYLNEVIDRRTGIPITLSVILIETARRIDLSLCGVGMPGHFLVKYADDELEVFIDPFNWGRLISLEGCREIFEGIYGSRSSFQRSFLVNMTKKQILTRMLLNLKGIYVRAKDNQKSLSVIERLLLIDPAAAGEIRDRGLIYFSMDRYALAQADLEEYLRRVPNADDTKEIRTKLGELRRRQARLN